MVDKQRSDQKRQCRVASNFNESPNRSQSINLQGCQQDVACHKDAPVDGGNRVEGDRTKLVIAGDVDAATDRDEQCEGESLGKRVSEDQTSVDGCNVGEGNVGDG